MSTYQQPFCASFKPSLLDTEADRKETDQRSKAEESASGQALVATDGHYLEALVAGQMRAQAWLSSPCSPSQQIPHELLSRVPL